MGAVLDALHRLQEIELQLAEVHQRIEARVRAAAAQERRLKQISEEIDAKRKELLARQMEADRLNLEIKSNEEKIAKLRAALNAARTNKEYSAVLAQLNTDKANNAKVEERLLALLSELDEARKRLAEDEQRLAAERAKLADLSQAAADTKEQSADRLEKLRAERAVAAAAVPSGALEMFERLARKNEGRALSLLIRINPRREEFACSSCNMSVTLEQVNAIITRDEPVLCHVCGQMLYLERTAETRVR